MKVWRQIWKGVSHVEMCFMYTNLVDFCIGKKRLWLDEMPRFMPTEYMCRSQENTKKLTEKKIPLFSEKGVRYTVPKVFTHAFRSYAED